MSDYDVIVYKYGCPASADFSEAAMQQLRLANDFWNSLVEVHRDYEKTIAAIWSTYPLVAAHQEAVDAASATCDEIAEQMRNRRKKDRTTAPRAEDRQRLAEARKVRRVAKASLKEAKEAAFAEGAQARIAEAGKSRAEDLKTARRKAAAEGLYWGTYNDIMQRRFPAAVERVKGQRKNGQWAELKFHRFDGTGTLTTQIQRQAADPVPTAAVLASEGGKWRNVVQFGPWTDPATIDRPRGRQRHGVLRVRVSRDDHLTVRVVLHRMLPTDAEIKEIKVTRRRIAGQYRLSVAVAFRIPRPAEKTAGDVVDIDFGWASGGKDVGLRVARIATASGTLPTPPADVADLVTSSDWHEVWFPAAWRDLLGRDDAIHADRDELLNEVRDRLVAALNGDPGLVEMVGATGGEVSRWRSPGRFAALTIRLRGDDASAEASNPRLDSVREHLVADLEAWRKRDRHLWEYECHERDQVIARRRDAYRKIAAWVAEAARLIVIQDLDVASLRRVPSVASEDPHQQRHGRRQLHAAAPGEFRAAVENAARRRGVQVVYRTYEEASDEQP